MVDFSEDFGDGGRPETFEDFVIFFSADALIDDVSGRGIFGDAVAHERLGDKGESPFVSTEFLPGVPVAITFEVRSENLLRTVFGDESDSWAADGVTEFNN